MELFRISFRARPLFSGGRDALKQIVEVGRLEGRSAGPGNDRIEKPFAAKEYAFEPPLDELDFNRAGRVHPRERAGVAANGFAGAERVVERGAVDL